MNAMQVRGQWKQVRGEVKSRWYGLRGNAFGRLNARMLKMMGRFQYNCGAARHTAEKQWSKMTRH